jgi:class 3 adenylate cyclase
LFSDVRGSPTVAKAPGVSRFSQLIDHFYHTASQELAEEDALIDKITGDQAAGMFVPGAGHAARAIESLQNNPPRKDYFRDNPSGP